MSKFIENLYLDYIDIFSWRVCCIKLSSIDQKKPMQSKENCMKTNAWKITDFERIEMEYWCCDISGMQTYNQT